MNINDLKNKVVSLIETQREDDYWDFKQCHHKNKADLLHDIICMANNRSDNDGYIIFGIQDKTFDIIGVENDENRRAQQNIIDFLKSKTFFMSIRPKIQAVLTIHTNIEGIASTSTDTLPHGKYRIDESKSPTGYLTNGAISREFEITIDGEMIDLTTEDTSIYNQIKRGDIEGVKIDTGTHKRLADVPFKITSKTTGESHIVVTDDNGQFSTASSWTSHKQNINAGTSSENGIWFGTSEPDDSKGALLYDTYEIEELRSDSNKEYTLIPPIEIIVSKDKSIIDLGTLTNEYKNEIMIHTTATDKETGGKTIVAGKDITIIDTVTLEGLTKGTD